MPVRKHELSLLEIFKDYSPVQMSNGQIRMECPFRENHADGSGRMSFFLSPDINAYHCFSCGAKGNLVKLLTTRFKVNYFEAVKLVRLTEYKKEDTEFDLDVIWDYYKSPDEFVRRGYSKDTLRHFRVGVTTADEIVIPYYKDFNHPTELLGYQKRWYVKDDRRVRNNKGFNKKEYLYNLDDSYEYVVLVEGQSDVWRLYQHGYNACAVMGSDLSIWQRDRLTCFKRIYLALDNDPAGRRATEICYHLLKNHADVKLVPYTSKDPGECSKKEWVKAFGESTDYLVYSMEMSMGWDGYLDMQGEVLNELERRSE